MDFRKYEVFLRTLECGSLTRAGEELGYTQSGVSHMMKSLEEEVGFRLFSRGRAGVAGRRRLGVFGCRRPGFFIKSAAGQREHCASSYKK